MTIANISNNVQVLLTKTNKFTTVLPCPPEQETDFAGFPSVAHYYVDTENDFATVSQNRRVIEYAVELYLVTPESAEVEFAKAYELMDSMVQMFDESIDLSSEAHNLPRACDIMRPAPGNMQRISTKDGDGLMMTIRLFCEADVNFR